MTWRIHPVIIFLALLGIFVTCYISVLRASYGFSDDYAILMGLARGTPSYHVAIAGGRPTYALLLRIFFAPLEGIGDLQYVRLFGVFFTAVLMFCVYRFLVHRGWEALSSFFFVVILGALPSFQVYASWATVSFYPCAMLASAGGLLCVERACAESQNGRPWWWAVAAVGFVTLALTIHQSSAMFFWFFAAVILLSPQVTGTNLFRRLWWYGGVMAVSLLLGFIIFRIGIWLYGIGPVGPQRASIVTNLPEKISWFLREPLINAFNGIFLFPTPQLAIAIGLWAAGGLTLLLQGTGKEKITKSICLLALLPLSYLPNLLVAENWASYRTLGVLAPLVMLYVFAALSGYEQFLRRFVTVRLCPMILGVVALYSTVLAARQVSTYFAIPQHQELEFMRARLARVDWSQVRSLYFSGGNELSALRGAQLPARYDEFGSCSLIPHWSVLAMPYLLLHALAPERREVPTALASPDDKTPPADVLVIDLREFSSFMAGTPKS